MSIQNIKTVSDIKAANKIEQMKQDARQRAAEQKALQIKKRTTDMKRGQFKKIVIDTFIEQFANNYGAGFDYNSIINALSFSEHTGGDGETVFDFNFKDKNVVFTTDAKRECREFNENSYEDFITNDDTIAGDYLSVDYFDNRDEYKGYEIEGEIEDELSSVDESNFTDGIFIPTFDNKDRYGNFNRINKLLGFAPTNVTAKEAGTKIKNKLKKIYGK